MLDKLQSLKDRFEEVGQLIILPDSMSDMSAYAKLTKEYKDLEKFVGVADAYTLVLQNIDSSKEILDKEKDQEFREMAKAELDELRHKKIELEEELKQLLTPKDPNDSKDCILEIRGGTGGDEAAIFAGDLFRMYERFCEIPDLRLRRGLQRNHRHRIRSRCIRHAQVRVWRTPGATRTCYRISRTGAYLRCLCGSSTRNG